MSSSDQQMQRIKDVDVKIELYEIGCRHTSVTKHGST